MQKSSLSSACYAAQRRSARPALTQTWPRSVEVAMSSSDDTIDVRVRITRAENPFLFNAVSELEAGPGVGLRNGFIKPLVEVGLMVDEERMRREPGVSTRTAGGLTAALGDHLNGVDAKPAASPAPLAEPEQPLEAPAVASSAPATVASASAHVAALLPNDLARSPSRVSGSGPRQMLGGYTGD